MKLGVGIVLGAVFLAAMSLPAAAQDPSDPVFDENTVSTVQVTMSAADWTALRDNQQDHTWRKATFTWQGETVTNVGVRASGGGLADPNGPWYLREKPSMQVSFEEFVPTQKWRGMTRVRLDAVGSWDMRARMGYWAHRQFGVPASRYSNCRLYVNGEYRGCYGVEELVRKAFVRYRWPVVGDGNLYKPETTAANNWMDAYLWKDANPASYVPVPFDPVTNSVGGNYSDVPGLLNVLNNVAAAQIRTELDKIANVPGMLAQLAVSASMGDDDSLWNWNQASRNHLIYHREDTNKLQFIPWDADGTFRAQPTASIWDPRPWSFSAATRWIPGDAIARASVENNVRAFLNGPLPAASARVDFIYNQIQSHVAGDPYSPYLTKPPWGPGSFAAEYQRSKDWIVQRIAYLKGQYPSAGPVVTIQATDPNAAEPASVGVFTITRTGSTAASLTVNRTRSGTATSGTDFAALPSPITIPAGQSSVMVTVTPIDDTAVEGDETVILTISPDAAYTVGTPSSATVTIADNDTAPTLPTVTIAATDPNAAEPTNVGVFTVTRTGSTGADLTVNRTRSGTATSGTDFTALPSPITIPAGQSSVTVTVTPIDDTAVEGNETVILTISPDAAYSVGTSSSATVTIADDDTVPTLPTVTIAATDPSAAEPTSVGVFTVSRTGSTSAALTVVRTRTGTATSGTDFTALPSPIVIPAGQSSVTVTVTPIDDTAVEGDETVILTLSADPAYTVGAASSATVTIADNDSAALPTVTITATDPSAAEPTNVGVFTVSRTGSTSAALTVPRVRTGTATSGADFTALPSPIVIPAGQSSVTVTVTPIDDTAVEGDETVILTLSADPAYTVGAASSATVTIADNDSAALPTVTITATDPIAAEPTNTGMFTVSRTGSTSSALTVPRVRTGTATSGTDFTALPSPIVIPAGQASVTVTVTPIDDTVDEGDETVILTLSPDPAYTVGAASSAIVTIADDDSVLPTVTITATDPNAGEPANVGVFTVSRTGSTANPLMVVRVRTGTATSGTDFAALPSPITIPAGQSSVTVTVTPIDDTAVEGNETVILTISADPAYTVGAASSATVTIADNDAAGGGLSATYYDNLDFTGTSVTRTDPVIDFNWATGSPDPSIGPDTFSARWTGRVQAQYSELYTFYSFTNDGVRLWVEGELLVDKWVQQSGGIEWSGQIALQAGQWYTIQMDHYEGTGNAVARLLWSSPSTPKDVIPQSHLDPALGPPDSRDNDGDGIPNDSDPDDDNDGTPDLQDPDRDGDGTTNLVEGSWGTDPDDATSVPSAAALAGRDNSNGDGGFLPNDKCSGTAGSAALPTWALLLVALIFVLALSNASRSR